MLGPTLGEPLVAPRVLGHCCVGQQGVRSGKGTHEAGAASSPTEGVRGGSPQFQERGRVSACVYM